MYISTVINTCTLIQLFIHVPEYICISPPPFSRDLPRYQSAMGCAMETARQCMPAGYKNYLPGSSSVKMMLSELCDHADGMALTLFFAFRLNSFTQYSYR